VFINPAIKKEMLNNNGFRLSFAVCAAYTLIHGG
jgi:hypothetical protein